MNTRDIAGASKIGNSGSSLKDAEKDRALPVALAELETVVSNAEGYQFAIEEQLGRLLDAPSRDSSGDDAAEPIRFSIVEVIGGLTERLRSLTGRQYDVLNRLHL